MASLPKLIPFPGAHPAGETRPETSADDAPSAAASTATTGACQDSLEAALAQVRQKWGYGSMKVVLADSRDRKPVRKICVLSHDGRELKLDDLTWVQRDSVGLRTAAE